MELGAVVLWLALFLALAFVGVPLAAALFPRLADRGASVAVPLVFVVAFLVSYWVGRISLRGSAVVTMLVLGVLVAVVFFRGVSVDTDAYLEVALVFTVAFCVLVAARAVDPAIVPAGGEKFLDFGLLKALLRAETLPPEDFWFAGEPMMYYYGGHLLVAQLIDATGTPPAVAYNLALAGFFASYVTAAYGLAGNVAARDGVFGRQAGLLAAAFVGLAGTLFTPLRLALRPLPDDLAESIASEVGVWAGRFPDSRQGALITDRQSFSMWDATGVIDGAIHEMPIFAFVNGDLHAHMMAPPFTLLAATVLFAYWVTPATDRRRRLGLLFGLVPAVAGTLAVVNTWSVPTVAGLVFLAVLFDRDATTTLCPRGLRARLADAGWLRTELAGVVLAGCAAGAVAVLGVVYSMPFWLANAADRSIGLFPDRSSLAELVVVHGGFLVPIAVYVGYLAWARFGADRRTIAVGAGGYLLAVAATTLATVPAVGLLVPVLLVGYLLSGRVGDVVADRPGVVDRLRGAGDRVEDLPGFEVVLVVGAVGLILLVEFVYLEENASSGRFNTVFKTYAQVWALFAVGVAVAVGRLLQLAEVTVPTPRWPTLVRGFAVVLVAVLSVYGVIAMGVHFGDFDAGSDDATLDGTTHLATYEPDRAAGIDWLDRRQGTPTIVTAPGDSYSWDSAPSAFTGIPTVVGWQHHEHGWGRSWESVQNRSGDVDSIYGADERRQRDLLAVYNVSYVWVGPSERDTYGAAISVGDLSALSRAASFGEVTIYEVDQAALDDERTES